MSLLRWLLLALVVPGVLAFAPMGSPAPVATAKSTSLLLLRVKLWRHDILRGRNQIIAPLLVCSPASAFWFLSVFPIRVESGTLLVSCFDSETY